VNCLTRSTALLLALSSGVEASARSLELPEEDITHSRPHAGDEAGAVALETSYTADLWRNEGGAADGWRYMDNLELRLNTDFERAFGWSGAKASISLLYNNGRSLSELSGDAQVVSNIETGVEALRVFEAFIEKDLGGDTSLLVGLYDLNSEFDALSNTDLFLGSAHGIGTDISQSGQNGPSIFPVTSLAVRVDHVVSDHLTLRAAVLDAVPGNPARPARTAISLDDGVLAVGEADISSGPVRVLLGAWAYDRGQPRLDGSGVATSYGAYLRGEWCLDGQASCRTSVFGRLGFADKRTNVFHAFASSGLVHHANDDIALGLAVAHAKAADNALAAQDIYGSETAIEATAAFQLSDWLTVQPNVQYVIDPAFVASGRDAVAIGLRLSISL